MKRTRVLLAVAVILGAPLCGAQLLEDEALPDAPVVVGESPSRPLDLSALADTPPALELVGDGRRTMGRFLPNLGRNLVGVLSPRNVAPLAFGAALTGAATMYDSRAERFFSHGQRAEELGKIGETAGGTTIMGPMTVALFLAGRASHDSRFRALTYDGLQASLVAGAYTTALKHTVGRPRPDGSDNLSFPSGHTSKAFAWAAVVSHHYGRRAGVAAYTVAGLIGASRMERSKHHLSDVLAGATLGWVAGRTVAHRDGEPTGSRRSLTLVPMSDASGSGAGVGLHFSF